MSENKKMKREHFAPGTLTAPLPPVLATVGDIENSNIITIAWTGILASTPPKTYISVRPTRHSYGILKERGEFVINLPSASLAREVDYAGIYTGAKVDKFEKCGFTKLESKEVSAPTIAECPIALECRVTEVVPLGSHDCFVADIVSVSCREDILENGRICYDKADLLAYAHGEYFALGEKLGRFGFSTDKRKKAESEAVKPKAKEKTAREASLKPSDEPKKKQSSKPKKRGKKPFKKPQKSSIKL
jgi:flavin reductase (DIM6/NTAB) family NADH-FMN oxidoreductase RutF